MIVDIFSCFDDRNLVFINASTLIWVLGLSFLCVLVCSMWEDKGRFSGLLFSLKEIIYRQALRTAGRKLGGFRVGLVSLFCFLVILNLCGLVPYVFSWTSHLVFSVSLGLPIWFSLIASGALFNPKSAAASLLPIGAPGLLNPFLILIETVRIRVRPLTLSLRLAANMAAGHIILGLVGNFLPAREDLLRVVLLVVFQVCYTLFEVAICIIQAYIFCLLLSLYSDEHRRYSQKQNE